MPKAELMFYCEVMGVCFGSFSSDFAKDVLQAQLRQDRLSPSISTATYEPAQSSSSDESATADDDDIEADLQAKLVRQQAVSRVLFRAIQILNEDNKRQRESLTSEIAQDYKTEIENLKEYLKRAGEKNLGIFILYYQNKLTMFYGGTYNNH
jgi:hypothetical protein